MVLQPKCKRGWGLAECKCLALGSGDICWSAGTCKYQTNPPPHLVKKEIIVCPKCGEPLNKK
jgi:hypothetical protein